MNTTNETPDDSVELLRDLLRNRAPLTHEEATARYAAQQNSLGGMARFNQTLPADVANPEPLDDDDGNAFRGLFFSVLLLAIFASGMVLGALTLHFLTQ
jgi:hypothetical protein